MSHSREIKADRLNVAIVVDPVGKAGVEILTQYIRILKILCRKVYVVTGNFPEDKFLDQNVEIINIKGDDMQQASRATILSRFVLRQLRLSKPLIKTLPKVKIVLALGLSPILPILVAKILRKDVIKIASASLQQHAKLDFGTKSPTYYFALAVERLAYALSDRIITATTVDQLGLDRYRDKVLPGGLFVDAALFKLRKPLSQRRNIIGYIGRLERIKGVGNFVKAIPLIVENGDDVQFLIGGDGTLLKWIDEELHSSKLNHKVELTGWIPHDSLPDYLNELKLLVIPSYSETGPIIALEAMACGTPVLATPVGGIPGLIKNEKTGFILENNSPNEIERGVRDVLHYSRIDEVVRNALEVIEKDYSFQACVDRYKKILR